MIHFSASCKLKTAVPVANVNERLTRSELALAKGSFRHSRGKSIHSLQIPSQTHQIPFATGSSHSAQRELPEFHDPFDQTEYRLDGGLAQGVQLATSSRLQAMAHRLQWRRLSSQRPRFVKALAQRRMMSFSAQRDQWPNLCLHAGVDVVLAGISGIGNQRLDPSQSRRQGLQLFEHRHHLLLVIARLRQRRRTTSKLSVSTAAWAL